jgi:hypothetical protein
MFIRFQRTLAWLANGLVDYYFGHWPWAIVLLEQLIFLPTIFCPPRDGIIDLFRDVFFRSRPRDDEQGGAPRPKVEPPPQGYTGPFWTSPALLSCRPTRNLIPPRKVSSLYSDYSFRSVR